MKRFTLILIAALFVIILPSLAQEKRDYSKIDLMLVRGEAERAIDTCLQILSADSLNAEIYYKLGLAYQNLLPDDKSFDCFLRAASIDPGNALYKFMVAKTYFNKGKMNQAEPLLLDLCALDSMNWQYAFYLTSIYMQRGKYDESIKIYNKFSSRDTSNYVFLDKIGYAFLKKGETDKAIDLYTKSLGINNKNINALKNLSYLYSYVNEVDTAIQLLNRAIGIDSTDMDIYVRRANIYYLINYYSKAMVDYLKLIDSGDSTVLYLKRAGIGYSTWLKPAQGNKYLLEAYHRDSSDYETASYLAKNYQALHDTKNTIRYYKRVIKILTPVSQQLGIATIMMAEAQKSGGLYKDAISSYLSAFKISPDINIYMIVANLYDDKLNDIPNAITYYDLFLDNLKNSKANFKPDYVEAVKKRVAFLKEKQKTTIKK